MRPLPLLHAAALALLHAAALALLSAATALGGVEGPTNVRLSMQLIEMPLPTLTELLADPKRTGHQLHAASFELAKAGKAKLLETCVITCRSGQKAVVESVREVIYPTEYYPDRALPVPDKVPPPPKPPRAFDAAFSSAFETRNTGVTFEVAPTLSPGNIIDLHIAPELVNPVDLATWYEYRDEWGDASVRMPVFESWKTNTGITLLAGRFELLGVVAPCAADPVPAQLRKVLVFVRADAIPLRTGK